PRNARAVRVGNRPVQQARVVGLFPRVEQLARLHPWLDGACGGAGDTRDADAGARKVRDDERRDDKEQYLENDPTGHSQRDHPAYALMLLSWAPQLVRVP